LDVATGKAELAEAEVEMAPVDLADRPAALLVKLTRGSGCNSAEEIVNIQVRGCWTPDEDLRLKWAVSRFGPSNWTQIAREVGTRSGRQARDRWANWLRPDLSHKPFTPEEDRLLIELQGQIGNHWSAVAERMPGRGANQVKNRWYTTLCGRKPDGKREAESKDGCEASAPPAGADMLDETWMPTAFEFGDWFLPSEWGEEERNW
jgi:hypothetical protein